MMDSSRPQLAAAVWWLSVLLVVGSSSIAQARETSPSRAAADQSAAELRAAGLRQLQDGALVDAARSFESAYRLLPDGDGLYLLSRLAECEGRTRAAQDLARRYLAEVDPRSSAHADWRAAAQRILNLPEAPAGELAVLGPSGAFVRLDDRLVGRLPLSRPLWASAGAHRVLIATEPAHEKPRTFTAQVDLPPGRTLELRVQAEAGVVLITRVPSLVVLLEKSAVTSESEPRLLEAIGTAARREHLAIAAPQQSGELDARRADAADSLAWLDGLAQRAAAAYVLDARVVGPEQTSGPDRAAWSLRLRLISGATGELVNARQLTCSSCSTERMASLLEKELADALELARKRPYGELIVNSEPASAEVFRDGQRVGVTPYRRIAWAGDRQLELRRSGYTAWSGNVHIDDRQPTTLSITLQPEPQAAIVSLPAPQLMPVTKVVSRAATTARPRYRLILGGLSLATGLVLAGFGTSALALNGRCSPDTPATALECRQSYDAAPIGGALLGVGGAFVAAGGALLLIPSSRTRQVERRAALP